MVDEWGEDGDYGPGYGEHAAAEAVAWHLCLATADGGAWTAFSDWLEADPQHARAYDALAVSDAELTDALSPPDW